MGGEFLSLMFSFDFSQFVEMGSQREFINIWNVQFYFIDGEESVLM